MSDLCQAQGVPLKACYEASFCLSADVTAAYDPNFAEAYEVRNSAFFNTQLDLILRRLGVKTVILAGTQYPNCVRGTANDAMSYDYETVVCTDACSAKTPEVAEANIFDMRNMGIKCISLDEVKKTYK